MLANAQSSMTDKQVMEFVIKEHNAGSSQSQIVTKLMQRGVDIAQIRRVRKQYENSVNGEGLGRANGQGTGTDESRLRTNNGKTSTTATGTTTLSFFFIS